MQLPYSDELNIGYLSRLFDNTTTVISSSGSRQFCAQLMENITDLVLINLSMK